MDKQPQIQSINEALEWHEAISESIVNHRSVILASHAADMVPAISRFFGMTDSDIDIFFLNERSEIDAMCIVNIVAATEAAIRLDYHNRIRRNRNDSLSREYLALDRSLPSHRKSRPGFDEGGILDRMKDSGAIDVHLIARFRDVLRVRHWYAHGRYWLLKSNAASHMPLDTHAVCMGLISNLPA